LLGFQQSLKFRVLGFRLLQDGNIGVGIFPKREEIIASGTALCNVALNGLGTR